MGLKTYFSKLGENELMLGSILIIALTLLGNVFSYLFQFFMARLLGPEDYVVVAIITSILGLFAIPSLAVQTVVSKNTTELKVKKQEGKIHGLMNYALKKMLVLSFWFFVLYSILAVFISQRLEIKYIYFFIGGLFLFSAFTYPVLTGIVQGLKKFKDLGINFFVNCFVKFIAGVVLVSVGMGIFGAILGFLFGVVAAFIILFFNITNLINAKSEKFKINIFSKENIYPLMAMFFIVLFYSLDVIFAKAFFSSDIAGRYSVISLIGKTILFVIASIGTAMFPINTERHVSGGNTKSILRKAIALSVIVCATAIIFFSLFPKFIINLLFGVQYASAYNLLTYSAIAFSFCSLLYILILQNISMNKINGWKIIVLGLCFVIEISLFFLFHQTIEQFVIGFMTANIIAFFVGLVVLKK